MDRDWLFIGVGNRLRQDDGVGPWVADGLRKAGGRAICHEGDGAGLIDRFASEPALILIDATRHRGKPGTLTRIDAATGPLESSVFAKTTHDFGLAEAVEVARRIGLLPPRLLAFGIEGRDFGHGEGLSPPVAAAAAALLHEFGQRPAPPDSLP